MLLYQHLDSQYKHSNARDHIGGSLELGCPSPSRAHGIWKLGSGFPLLLRHNPMHKVITGVSTAIPHSKYRARIRKPSFDLNMSKTKQYLD